MASIFSHPCSGMTSGRYVAEKDCLEVILGRLKDDENGDGVSEEGKDETREGWGKVI